MNSISDEYERWFSEGNRDVRGFLFGRTLTDDEFRNCILTDQFLHHQAGMPINTSCYAEQLPRVADDDELQTELWLEAFGYLEEKAKLTNRRVRSSSTGFHSR